MTYKSNKKVERQYENVKTAYLASRLLQELNHVIEPLFKFIETQTSPESYDHFNRIRVLMPYVETASQLEYRGNVQSLLERLGVKKSKIVWAMFRHGLVHSIRPLNVTDVNGITYTWAIPHHPIDEHYEFGSSVGVVAPKLLFDLKIYIEAFLNKSGNTSFQTGIKYIKSDEMTLEDIKGRLLYVLQNCEIANRELCSVNEKLREAMNIRSSQNPEPLGELNKMIQGYLIVCIASLFDSDKRSVSFAHFFGGNEEFESIKQESIIKEIIKSRHTWIAHNDKDGEIIPTDTICRSNLKEILKRLKKLLS